MPNLCANNLHFFLTKPFLGVISAHIEKKKQLFSNFFSTTQIDCALTLYLCVVIENHTAKSGGASA